MTKVAKTSKWIIHFCLRFLSPSTLHSRSYTSQCRELMLKRRRGSDCPSCCSWTDCWAALDRWEELSRLGDAPWGRGKPRCLLAADLWGKQLGVQISREAVWPSVSEQRLCERQNIFRQHSRTPSTKTSSTLIQHPAAAQHSAGTLLKPRGS